MIDDVQREVALHLLANAIRKQRIAAARHAGAAASPLVDRRRSPEDAYLRGMLDLLRALHGRPLADELHRDAATLERGTVAL